LVGEECLVRAALTRLVAVAVAFWIAAALFHHNFGVAAGASTSSHWLTYLIDAIAFGLLNMTVGVVLRLITLPLRILTFGLFNIVINAALIGILSALPLATHVRLRASLVGAFEAALTLAVVSGLVDLVDSKKKVKKKLRKALT
jgi:putative membrane protein